MALNFILYPYDYIQTIYAGTSSCLIIEESQTKLKVLKNELSN